MSGTVTPGSSRISVRGVVQGVGFRPFVYRLAQRHRLRGWVGNTSGDVRIEVEGEPANIKLFLHDLRDEAPPMSRIEAITVTPGVPGVPAAYQTFEIRPSLPEAGRYQLVSPDIGTCPACLQEVFDPADRRYRYPFTNCTNCGPRFTIITDIPYDRPKTTMKGFTMCPACQREYDNPLDRRFHAQPNACPICGPRLELTDAGGEVLAVDDPVRETARLLKGGNIIAVKGLGGYLLACDATSRGVVAMLRQRKNRPAKPLAVMVASIDEAKKHGDINREEAELLASPSSPIVLVSWREDSEITEIVAPGLKYLGIMLPYTPLHHLLLRETGLPLVMTSGNLSEEPIAADNDEALVRLGGIADYFLQHNRYIYARYDDSVVAVIGESSRFIRRARGYAPYPIKMNRAFRPVLACGAEEKNTFCLTRDSYAFLSQHIGDMENLETLEHFRNTIDFYKKLFRIEPEIIACDMHPEYLPTKFALELASGGSGLKIAPVQHHHAHIASCMADNGLEGDVIGVSLDGTGYGTDGSIWGGEFITADYRDFTRVGYLEYLPLPGGTLAIKRPYRTAVGYLAALGLDFDGLDFLRDIDPGEIDIIRRQAAGRLNTPFTSSMGRLFDAVAALLGFRNEILYEAQAAIELETLAAGASGETGTYPFRIIEENGINIIKVRDLFNELIADIEKALPRENSAMMFHNTVARVILDLCRNIRENTGLKRVALSGGVFQNRILLEKSLAILEESGFSVFTHRQVPCNDGGIALGQAVIAGARDA